MEFGLLGPLTVVEGGSDVTPARPKQRALLALLLLRRGEVVPGAQLIEALWGEEPPETAQTALHGHISNLRKLVGPERIRTRPPGYRLDVSPGEVDLARFEALVAQARERDDPAARSACLREALALWRGEPLVELRGEPFADREIARLDELRVTALEDRIEADLALGRHHELVPELEPLVTEHQFRERLRGQLMLALYRCGRQAEALHVYQSDAERSSKSSASTPGRRSSSSSCASFVKTRAWACRPAGPGASRRPGESRPLAVVDPDRDAPLPSDGPMIGAPRSSSA